MKSEVEGFTVQYKCKEGANLVNKKELKEQNQFLTS